jgi:hypothetical protein
MSRARKALTGVAAAILSLSAANAEEACGLCSTAVVLNSDLASCFLENYEQFAKEDRPANAVDLSICGSRGIVEALPTPDSAILEPETQFMISRTQLDCLKKKLEEPGLVLDPSAKIELDGCE